jgi:hypothetical protein
MMPAWCRAYLVLGFRLGLRRGEILGLQVGDIHWGPEPLLYVRKNPHRSLKTRNAPRLLPLSALTGEERAILEQLTNERGAEQFLFFDAPPTAADLESPAVVARVSDLLFRVSGDPAMHGHNLRHSFATWGLLGMLGPDLGIDVHPYAEPWMRRTVNFGSRLHRDLSGSLHRLGGRGSALATALGHGSEITSFQHYVHCLDLLLFLATNRSQHDETFGPQGTRDRFRTNEPALVTALAGYAPTSRLPTDDIAALLSVLVNGAGGAFHSYSPARRAVSTAVATSRLPRFVQLLADPKIRAVPGRPKQQGELDSASAFLDTLSGVDGPQYDVMLEALRLWDRYALSDNLWASFSAEDAGRFLDLWRECFPDVQPVVMHVHTPRGERSPKKELIATNKVRRALKRKFGRFWIRVPDEKPGQSKQGAVGWVICALVRALATVDGGLPDQLPAAADP